MQKARVRHVVTILAGIGLVLAWVAYFSTSTRQAPVLEAPGLAPLYTTRPASPNPQFGVAMGNTLLGMSDQQLNARLADVANLGASWVRIDFDWSDIQPQPGNFTWAPHDRLLRAAMAHHLKVLGILTYTPAWAASQNCLVRYKNKADQQKCAPANATAFAQFAMAAAKRYNPTRVAAWELWNEPNNIGFWHSITANGQAVVSPTAYATLATQAASAIKQVRPQAFVLTGGLAPFATTGSQGMQAAQFLRSALPYLQANMFDGVGVHPYTAPALPTTPADWDAYYALTQGSNNANLLHILTDAGWSSKLLWLTEFGASTVGNKQQAATALSAPADLQNYDHVTEPLQANILQQGITRLCRQPNMGPLFIYTDTDQYLSSPAATERGYGLRRQNGAPKPAYPAVQQAIASARQSCQ